MPQGDAATARRGQGSGTLARMSSLPDAVLPRRTADAGTPSREAEVFVRCVELLDRNARIGIATGIGALAIIGIALFPQQWPPLAYWLQAAVIAAVLSLQLLLPRQALEPGRLTAATRQRTTRSLVVMALATSIAWGSLHPVFMGPETDRVAVLLCIAMAVLVSFSMGSASFLPATYALNLPLALMFIVPAALQPTVHARLAAVTAAIITALMLAFAHKSHRMLVDSVRMRFENRDLADALTEQRVRERTRVIEEASRQKSDFLASMSDELRTPLNAIIGRSAALQELAPALLPDLRKIDVAGRQLLALIDSALDLSKIQAGKMALFEESFSLYELAAEVRDLVDPLAAGNGNRFEVRLDAAIDRVHGDRAKLRQVLLKLLSNACRFTHHGSILLDIGLAVDGGVSARGGLLRMVVRDTGIGLSAEQIESLFQPFGQAAARVAQPHGGTGLGLALCRHLCRMMGGDVEVHSEPGRGSAFVARVEVGLPAA